MKGGADIASWIIGTIVGGVIAVVVFFAVYFTRNKDRTPSENALPEDQKKYSPDTLVVGS